jgi:hypothetical protein
MKVPKPANQHTKIFKISSRVVSRLQTFPVFPPPPSFQGSPWLLTPPISPRLRPGCNSWRATLQRSHRLSKLSSTFRPDGQPQMYSQVSRIQRLKVLKPLLHIMSPCSTNEMRRAVPPDTLSPQAQMTSEVIEHRDGHF